MPRFKAHSLKQQRALLSKKRIILVATGIQYGKSTVGAWKMRTWMHTFTAVDDNFIITAPTYKIMQQATLPAFRLAMEGYGDWDKDYSKGDAVYHMQGGGTVYFRTSSDPDSIIGITNVRGIWGDEAGKYSLYFWENIQARASIKECSVILTTSPYTVNWVHKDLIKPAMREANTEEVELVQARSNENPYFPQREFERKQKTMDSRRFNMVYGGQFNKMEGLVYSCFSIDQHVTKPRTLPDGTRYVAGVDWGFTNPSSIIILAVTPDGHYFVVDEHYETQLTIGDLMEVAKRKTAVFSIDTFHCDPSSPANIEEFNRERLTAVKANNEIRLGVDRVYELLKEGKLKFFEGKCKYLIDEIEGYHYPEEPDIDGNKDIKELSPVKQNDHAVDALRYVVAATYHTGAKKTIPRVYGESDDKRMRPEPPAMIESLKDMPEPCSEDWS